MSYLVLSVNLTFGQYKTEIYVYNTTSESYNITGHIYNGSTPTPFSFTVPANTNHVETFVNWTPHWTSDMRTAHSSGIPPYPTIPNFSQVDVYVYAPGGNKKVTQAPYTYGAGNYYQFYTIH
ncbi:MAG: hypothetical protein K9H64_08280 [Bacteroidales bacterium]|nr:hypothetical protein [Bacteroidales bacterium]MCF8455828.1 hypothetical protein [Bacteroidales bacterium]